MGKFKRLGKGVIFNKSCQDERTSITHASSQRKGSITSFLSVEKGTESVTLEVWPLSEMFKWHKVGCRESPRCVATRRLHLHCAWLSEAIAATEPFPAHCPQFTQEVSIDGAKVTVSAPAVREVQEDEDKAAVLQVHMCARVCAICVSVRANV